MSGIGLGHHHTIQPQHDLHLTCGPCGGRIGHTEEQLSFDWLVQSVRMFGSIYARCPVCFRRIETRDRSYEHRVRTILGSDLIKRVRTAAKRPVSHAPSPQSAFLDLTHTAMSPSEILFQALGNPCDLRLDPALLRVGDYAIVADHDEALIGGIWFLRLREGQVIRTGLEGEVITGRHYFRRFVNGHNLLGGIVGDQFSLVRTLGRDMDGVSIPFSLLQPLP